MKTFFDGIYIDKDKLQKAGITYPIKLEYYKTISEDENVEAKFGIKIVKTEYISGKINVEINQFKHLTNNVEEIDKILSVLRNNEVTPIAMQDVLEDMFIKI